MARGVSDRNGPPAIASGRVGPNRTVPPGENLSYAEDRIALELAMAESSFPEDAEAPEELIGPQSASTGALAVRLEAESSLRAAYRRRASSSVPVEDWDDVEE